MNRHLKSLLSVLTFGLSGMFDKDMKNSFREYKNSGELSNVLSSLQGRYTGSNLTGAEIASNEFNASEAEKARQFSSEEAEKARNFEMEMANTAKQRQVQDYVAAGINPMFAAGQSVSLPSASNAASMQAASVSPSSAAFNIPGLISAISQLRVNKAQAEALHSQSDQSKAAAENLRADAALKDEQRKGQIFINEVNELTKDVQVQQKKANLDISQKQLQEMDKKIEQMDADIGKKIEETNTELAKQALMCTQQALNRASAHLQYTQAKEINEMLEYNKRLSAARTMHEKAAAGLAGVQAAYQNGLITGGYIDKLIEKVGAEAGIKLNEQQISDINTALRTGDYSNTNINDKSLFQQIFTSEGFVQAVTIFLDNFNPLSGIIGIAP